MCTHVTRVYSYVTRMYSYVTRMYSYVTRIYSCVLVCYSYVLVCYSCVVLVTIHKCDLSKPLVYVFTYVKTYTNGFVFNDQSHWVAVDNPLKVFTKVLEVLEKPLCFFPCPLEVLKKAVRNFFPNRWKCWKKSSKQFLLSIEDDQKSADRRRWVHWKKLL